MQIRLKNLGYYKIIKIIKKQGFSKNSFNYFIGYKDNKKATSLCMTSAYRKNFDETK